MAGASLGPADREQMRELIRQRGVEVVGQEVVRLSTMPVWEAGRLRPHPFTLRAYVVATADGWEVLPGGFGRVAEGQDPRALSMQHGGRSTDVWITSARPANTLSV